MEQRVVFISYKSDEFEEADWVRKELEQEGISCWMAPMCISGGSNYAAEIPKAIRECQIFVLILSQRAQESIWIPRELDQAINAGKKIMPFVIDEVVLDDVFGFYLANVQQYFAVYDKKQVIRRLILDIKKTLYLQNMVSNVEENRNEIYPEINLAECMQLDRGLVSEELFQEEEKGRIVLQSPLILITNQDINEQEELAAFLMKIERIGSDLLIVASNFSREVVELLCAEKRYRGFSVAAIEAPSHGERREELLYDLALLTGGHVISKEDGILFSQVNLNDLGCAELVEIQQDETKISGGMGTVELVEDRIVQIRKKLKQTYSTFEKKNLQKRMENLSAGVVRHPEIFSRERIVTRKYANATYVGTVNDGVPDGTGRMEYITGEIYEGDWLAGEICGKGRFFSIEGEQYEGEFQNNVIQGTGIKLYVDGSKYTGEWKCGRRHGHGRYEQNGDIYDGVWSDDRFLAGKTVIKYSDGSQYEGDWENDRQHGQGIYYAKNGNIYDGKWDDSQFVSGKCVIKYLDGRIYNGEWSRGNYNGKGKLLYSDGSYYEGEWVDGVRWGEGECRWPNGTIYKGQWKNGIADGYGTRKVGNAQYEGQWKEGKRHGHGTLIYANGDKHEGEWVNGHPCGFGTYTYSDGAVKTGIFQNDLLWSGSGTVRYDSGEVYIGQIENGLFHGNGLLIQSDGSQIHGMFEEGLPHGKVVYTDSEGQQYSCKYNHGKQILFSVKKL